VRNLNITKMKRLLTLALLLIFAGLLNSAVAQKNLKIGHVYVDSIIPVMDEIDSLRGMLLAKDAEFKKIYQLYQTEASNWYTNTYLPNYDSLPPSLQAEWDTTLQNYNKKLRNVEIKYGRELNQIQQQFYDDLIQRVKDVISEIAKEKAYTYIFNANEAETFISIVYADESRNLTSAVFKKLNIDAKAKYEELNKQMQMQNGGAQPGGGVVRQPQ
jgi:outer membrane protein